MQQALTFASARHPYLASKALRAQAPMPVSIEACMCALYVCGQVTDDKAIADSLAQEEQEADNKALEV